MSEGNGSPLELSTGPRCQYCGEILVFGSRTIVSQTGGVYELTWCANAKCSKLLSMQFIGRQQLTVADPTRKDGGLIRLT
jgi:hypothetical protein